VAVSFPACSQNYPTMYYKFTLAIDVDHSVSFRVFSNPLMSVYLQLLFFLYPCQNSWPQLSTPAMLSQPVFRLWQSENVTGISCLSVSALSWCCDFTSRWAQAPNHSSVSVPLCLLHSCPCLGHSGTSLQLHLARPSEPTQMSSWLMSPTYGWVMLSWFLLTRAVVFFPLGFFSKYF
jgi:hypothetical protein